MSAEAQKGEHRNSKQEVRKMTEREKRIIESIAKTVPNLDDFSKGFLCGYLSAKEEEKKTEEKKEESDASEEGVK